MSGQPYSGKTDLMLESITPAEWKAEQARLEQRRKMHTRLNRRLTGGAGDLTATLPGMGGTSDVPLFT